MTKIPRTWTTIALLLCCAGATWLVPGLEAYRPAGPARLLEALAAPWRGNPFRKVFRIPHRAADSTPPKAAPDPAPAPAPAAEETAGDWPSGASEDAWAASAAGSVAIEDYGGQLARFHAALRRTERMEPRAVTRISHFGDSPVTGDLVSGDARALLQARFGDAGHGWIFVDRPWEWYNHRGVRLSGGGWSIQSPMIPPGRPGPYGLGGAAFSAGGGSAKSRIGTGARGAGSRVSRFDVHFQSQPSGGTLLASVDGGAASEIPTASEDGGGLAVHSIAVPDGEHELSLRPKGDGPVRLYGVVLERERPGVVYDTIGANGATIRHLARFDRESWMDSLRRRRPDLVILHYGTNESGYAGLSFRAYEKDYREVIGRIREALPGCAILLMAPMDRGERGEGGEIRTTPAIPRLAAAQRIIARRERVAFFDTYAAMGGRGTMADWYARSPRLVSGDFTHPTHKGAAVLGDLLVRALLKGYPVHRIEETSKPEGTGR